MSANFATFLLLLSLISRLNGEKYTNSLDTNKKDIQVDVGESDSFELFVRNEKALNFSFAVTVGCDSSDGKCKTFSPRDSTTVTFSPLDFRFRFNTTATTAGHDVIIARVVRNDTHVDDSEAFVRVRVGRSPVWSVLATVVGWVYFVIWSASFWPQNISNFRRKSVVGFNLDFAALNVTGFLFYSIFNSGLYFSPKVQALYEEAFPRSEIPIEFNDVVYAYHAAFATAITLIQCYVYERGEQRMSLLGKVFTGVTWTAAGVQLVLCWTGVMSWLTFMYYFSYVKLVVTSVKYLPQAYFNYKRKSTRGWSIWMIYMDITGGINGLLQMLFIAYNFDDWKTIFGNFAKFGLSVASISYDILFFLQEYVFYRKQDSSLQPLNEEKRFSKSERKKSRVSIVSLTSENREYPRVSVDYSALSDRRKSAVSVISAKSVESFKNVFTY
ncbi:unnamed protein product [Oppiella nova]|uniref:Cystinosin n=1 Tax=Oppiella nova TaxID=334625 RepID=A0A7R9MAX8_9ACAR|nr:unnamed protein product [Oppiella nova]CAG2173854.1 unnamed protein product [Oppiella nova]